MLKWLRSKSNGCPWDERTYANAAMGGHSDVLKWARANGCPWDKEMCSFAVRKGDMKILEWLRENGCPCYGKLH